jgi:hypothetical protein
MGNEGGMAVLEALGLKSGAVVAGFVGGVVSLSMLRDLTPLRAVGTVLGGTACAAYLTPLAIEYSGLSGSSEHALAFFLGVCGMNGVAGVFKISEKFKTNPAETMAEIKKGKL